MSTKNRDTSISIPLRKLVKLVKIYKANGKTIGLCDGNYDLLHPGHIMHFEAAKKFCDILIVAVAEDKSVERRKGTNRPIFNENLRAYMVGMVKSVDFVILNKNNSVTKILEVVRPTYFIKGLDYINSKEDKFRVERQHAIKQGVMVRYTRSKKLATRDIIKAIKTDRKYI